jgi:predicted nucleic acid-binding protein
MNCYVDSSVLIRKLFSEPGALKEWFKITVSFSSRILKLECLRTYDRWKVRGQAPPHEIAAKHSELGELMRSVSLLPLTARVLEQAEQPCPVSLASLDAIHLATALFWREKHGDDFFFATHDQELGLAAKAYGLTVIGL